MRYLKPSQAARAIEECDRSKNLTEFFKVSHNECVPSFVYLLIFSVVCRQIILQVKIILLLFT